MFDNLDTIYKVFQDLNNNSEKVNFLKELQQKNLSYNINYENLIKYYENNL